jgi:hypothetical protein
VAVVVVVVKSIAVKSQTRNGTDQQIGPTGKRMSVAEVQTLVYPNVNCEIEHDSTGNNTNSRPRKMELHQKTRKTKQGHLDDWK